MNERVCIFLMAVALVGCTSTPTEPFAAPEGFATAVMKPDTRMRGTIKTVNDQGQYVIIDFGLGMMPPLKAGMNVYRANEIVGSVQLTGPVRGSIVAGDILSGEAAVGDQAILDEAPQEIDGVETGE